MSHFDLSDRLQRMKDFGVEVPMLRNSNLMPFYVETRSDGTEIYQLGGTEIKVRAGQIIDSHGNVVDLERLQKQTNFLMCQYESNSR